MFVATSVRQHLAQAQLLLAVSTLGREATNPCRYWTEASNAHHGNGFPKEWSAACGLRSEYFKTGGGPVGGGARCWLQHELGGLTFVLFSLSLGPSLSTYIYIETSLSLSPSLSVSLLPKRPNQFLWRQLSLLTF